MVDATMEQNLKLLFKTYLLLTKSLIINEITEIISKNTRILIDFGNDLEDTKETFELDGLTYGKSKLYSGQNFRLLYLMQEPDRKAFYHLNQS